MGRAIIKLHDYYFEYSTIPDAPVTFGMKREEFEEYYRQEYGNAGMKGLKPRMDRVDDKGTSFIDDKSAEDTLSCNRAGPNEEELTADEIYKAYCLREPIRDGWKPEEA